QVVQEALKEDSKKVKTSITLSIENNLDVEITIQTGDISNKIVINSSGKNLNTSELHKELIKLKQQYPEVFKIDLRPNGSVPYDLIVQIMDEARKSRDPNIMFPIFDKAKNETTQTPYMFPEVIFVNTTEG
ncbi:MAG TPA: biopolymer transporter ExbD, partial [Pseudobdellovibrionaceae bacterium]|nr:biopolymer transporter ExbD [Pseudobdellovibrionaceae bacterium]